MNCAPVLSPDGQSVAFLRVRGQEEQVVTMRLDNLEEKVLFTTAEEDGGVGNDWPAWSPDGKLLALSLQGIYVMKADGSGAQRVVDTGWDGYYQFFATHWQSNDRLDFVSEAQGGD